MTALKSVDALHRESSIIERLQLASEVLRAYARVRWMLRRRGLDQTLAAVREPIARTGPSAVPAGMQRLNALRLGRVVVRTLRRLPGDTRCLTRSLVLTTLLAERGIPSRLVIGVRPAPDFTAHAWLECGELPVLPLAEADAAGRLVEL